MRTAVAGLGGAHGLLLMSEDDGDRIPVVSNGFRIDPRRRELQGARGR